MNIKVLFNFGNVLFNKLFWLFCMLDITRFYEPTMAKPKGNIMNLKACVCISVYVRDIVCYLVHPKLLIRFQQMRLLWIGLDKICPRLYDIKGNWKWFTLDIMMWNCAPKIVMLSFTFFLISSLLPPPIYIYIYLLKFIIHLFNYNKSCIFCKQ